MTEGRMGRRSFLAAALTAVAALLASLLTAGREAPPARPGLAGHRARHWRRLAG